MPDHLTDYEEEVVRALESWHRRHGPDGAIPLDLGASNGSHHSGTLNRLCRKGIVARTSRNPLATRRGSYRYALTETGLSLASERVSRVAVEGGA